MSTLDILRKLALQTENMPDFFAYVLPGANVQATVSGIKINLKVSGVDFVGVAILRPNISNRSASLVQPATYEQTEAYLNRFPRSPGVVFRNRFGSWLVSVNRKTFPVYGINEMTQDFEIIKVHKIFDGVFVAGRPILDALNTATNMRRELANLTKHPIVSGMTPDHVCAYMASFNDTNPPENVFKKSVRFMGGDLLDYSDRKDGTALVTYAVSGKTFTSLVNSRNMQVISSGICLDGEDSNYDLATLVPVLRKGIQENKIVTVGLHGDDSYDYDDD